MQSSKSIALTVKRSYESELRVSPRRTGLGGHWDVFFPLEPGEHAIVGV